jgi:hypothetical protein
MAFKEGSMLNLFSIKNVFLCESHFPVTCNHYLILRFFRRNYAKYALISQVSFKRNFSEMDASNNSTVKGYHVFPHLKIHVFHAYSFRFKSKQPQYSKSQIF